MFSHQKLSEGMSPEEIIKLAASREEYVWQWGLRISPKEVESYAQSMGLTAHWGAPIRSGDLYLARRKGGWHLLECRTLGEAFVVPEKNGYCFDFNECVKVVES